MFVPRVIPVLLLQGRGLVKTIKFNDGKYIGDPINAVKLFNDLKADELIFLDILATKGKREILHDLVADIGSQANMPFAVGGGIKTLNDIQNVIAKGAEKVVINSHALRCPDFIRDAASNFGSSTISVCMDVKATWLGAKKVWSHASQKATNYDPVAYARLMQDLGAGELIVQSVDQDGVMGGYDIPLIKAISEAVTIPVVALGGAGCLADISTVCKDGYASAVGVGSLFVYQSSKRGVLINYPSRSDIRTLFR